MVDRTPPRRQLREALTPALGFFWGGGAWTSAGCSGGNGPRHLWTCSSWRFLTDVSRGDGVMMA